MGYAPTFQADLSGFYNNLPRARKAREHKEKVQGKELELLDKNLRSADTMEKLRVQQMETAGIQQAILQNQMREQQNLAKAKAIFGEVLGGIPLEQDSDRYGGQIAAGLQQAMQSDPGVAPHLFKMMTEEGVVENAQGIHGQYLQGQIAEAEEVVSSMENLAAIEDNGEGAHTVMGPSQPYRDRLEQLRSWLPKGGGGEVIGIDEADNRAILRGRDGRISSQQYAPTDPKDELVPAGSAVRDPVTGEIKYKNEVNRAGGSVPDPLSTELRINGLRIPMEVVQGPEGGPILRPPIVEYETQEFTPPGQEKSIFIKAPVETPWDGMDLTVDLNRLNALLREAGADFEVTPEMAQRDPEGVLELSQAVGLTDPIGEDARVPERTVSRQSNTVKGLANSLDRAFGTAGSPEDLAEMYLTDPRDYEAARTSSSIHEGSANRRSTKEAISSMVPGSEEEGRNHDAWTKALGGPRILKQVGSEKMHPVVDADTKSQEAYQTGLKKIGNLLIAAQEKIDKNSYSYADLSAAITRQNIRGYFEDSESGRIMAGAVDGNMQAQGNILDKVDSFFKEVIKGRKPPEQRALAILAYSVGVRFMSDFRWDRMVNAHQAKDRFRANVVNDNWLEDNPGSSVRSGLLADHLPRALSYIAAGEEFDKRAVPEIDIPPESMYEVFQVVRNNPERLEGMIAAIHNLNTAQFKNPDTIYRSERFPGGEAVRTFHYELVGETQLAPYWSEKTRKQLAFDPDRQTHSEFQFRHSNGDLRTVHKYHDVDGEGGAIFFAYDIPALSRGFYVPAWELKDSMIINGLFPSDTWELLTPGR